MIYIEGFLEKSPINLRLFDFIKSNSFPLYASDSTYNKFPQFVHVLMDRSGIQGVEGKINSNFFPDFKSLLEQACSINNLKIKTIYRAAVNNTIYHPNEITSDIHTDHEFPHLNFLVYINDVDNGHTYIFDSDNNVIKSSSPEPFKYVIFSGEPHAQGFCAPGQVRTVLIMTFDTE